MTIFIIYVLFNIIISAVIASSVKNREISQEKVFFVSFFLTPLVGMFVSMMSPEIKEKDVEIKQEEIVEDTYEDSLIPFLERNIKYFVMGIMLIWLLIMMNNIFK